MSKLHSYHIYILRKDNDFDRIVIPVKLLKAKNIVNFKHRGHRYHFDKEYSYLVHDLGSIRYWLFPDFMQRDKRIVIYREPKDYKDWDFKQGEETPVEPLTVPVQTNIIEESPLILKGVTRSPLLHRYRAKQKFGKWAVPPWQLMLIIGIVVVIVLLVMTKTIAIPGVNVP